MSRELVESILAGDFVCANELFEEQLNILREQKLYEVKRSLQLVELMGYRGYGATKGPLAGKTDAEKRAFWKEKIAQRKAEKAYAQPKKQQNPEAVRASEVLPTTSEPKNTLLQRLAKSSLPYKAGKIVGGALSDIGSALEE